MGIYTKLNISEDTLKHLQVLWDYLKLNQPIEKSDLILVGGSHDLRVANRAAEIYLSSYAPLILFSGGLGTVTIDLWTEPEAIMFSKIAIEKGVPKENILIEDKAKHTGENVTLSYRLLKEKGIKPKSVILVSKPYSERRFYATFKKQWFDKDTLVYVTSPNLSMEEYLNTSLNKNRVVNQMVKEIDKIIENPKLGFQIEQEMPNEVLASKTYILENYIIQ